MRTVVGATFAVLTAFAFTPTTANAAGTVSWTSPANNSVFPVGTVVTPDGIASGGVSSGSGLDLVIVLDGSGSMNTTTLQAQAAAANALVAAVPQGTSNISIVSFGSSPNTLVPLTQSSAGNQAVFTNAINSVDDNLGGTATDTAIASAASILSANNNGASKQVVVITDGSPNNQSAAVNAAAAAAAGTPAVQVNTVGLPGTSFGNQQAIATAGGGVFVTATDQQTLIDLFTGSGGNLVGIDQIDILLPDGTLLSDVPLTSGLGNFDVTQGYAILEGVNTWTVNALFDDGSTAQSLVTVIGRASASVVPLPAGMWLMFAGLGGLGMLRRRK